MSKKPKSNLIDQSLTQVNKDVLSDIAEISLDTTMKKFVTDQELLRDLPVIKWLVAANSVWNSVHNAHFLKKYASFIGQISVEHITKEDVLLLKEDVLSAEVIEKITENTLIYIDRYHDEIKAKLLGQLFVETFVNYSFSGDEYNSLMFSIDSIHPFEGIPRLKEFYQYEIQVNAALNDDEKRKIWMQRAQLGYQPLVMSGLLHLPGGGSYAGSLGGASINELGFKFYEKVVRKVIN
ncbi:hypothetical protein [Shewanella sp. M-Br]|uniref:hypothetical protein n=1 Tax=Shewanella sp. M-Br TaxID=2495595 RepID=UPI00294974C7|nr:hypothetical protein SMBr_14830 [Shewanella sp. M-Br]